MSEIWILRADLTAIQAHEGLQNLLIDECDRERTTRSHLLSMSRPHNAKIRYFGNLTGKNFLAWCSQFQVIAKFIRWSDEEAKSMVYEYMKDTTLESAMDVDLTAPETVKEVMNEYQDQFLPECQSQLSRAQFACVVQLPNESLQKPYSSLGVLYHLAYPEAKDCSKIYLVKKFISMLNNQEVQNHVRCRKPTTYAKALNVANEETSFILMDLAAHATGRLQAPTPGDTSFIATLKGRRAYSGRTPEPSRKCYYCNEEGHFKEWCPLRLKDFLKQRADWGSRKAARSQTTCASRTSWEASPATRKKQVRFAEAQQTLPVVME